MSQVAEFRDDELIYGFMHEYLDEQLGHEDRKRFDGLMSQEKYKHLSQRFQNRRGEIQTLTRSLVMPFDLQNDLKSELIDTAAESHHEEVEIEQITRYESLIKTLRYVFIVALLGAAVGWGIYSFAPRQQQNFANLDYLVYEALAVQEDDSRLNFPTNDWVELRNYLVNYPGLGFSPAILVPFSDQWEPEGATVIDYDIDKVVAVKFHHKADGRALYHFSYGGRLADLPKVPETGNLGGLIFQTYATEKFNIIAWQQEGGVVSVFMSSLGAPEMAQLAQKGSLK